jgi:molybdate transport system substrate-binding protein
MNRRVILCVSKAILLGLSFLNTAGNATSAAEIRLLSAVALHPAIDALIPEFEMASGHRVNVAYGTAGGVADRIQKGEGADLVISAAPRIDQLQAQGKVVAESRVNFAKVGVGVFVRKGAAKPNISSPDAFKRAMLGARSIAYPDPAGGGASGIYVAALLERLGIAGEMKPKTKLLPPTEALYGSVASGDVEIGFNQISEILAQPTVELAGPLPAAPSRYQWESQTCDVVSLSPSLSPSVQAASGWKSYKIEIELLDSEMQLAFKIRRFNYLQETSDH